MKNSAQKLRAARNRRYYLKHKKQILAKAKHRKAISPEKRVAAGKRYYIKHRKEILAYAAAYREANRARIARYQRQYRKARKGKA